MSNLVSQLTLYSRECGLTEPEAKAKFKLSRGRRRLEQRAAEVSVTMDQSEAILKLRCQLKEVEEERGRAAQYGLQLLESQSDLQNQLEEQRSEMTSAIEILEQEKYSLQREVELKSRMQESLLSECESIKQQQKTCLEQLQQQLERSHTRERSELNNKIEKLKVELDEARLSEKQLKHKVDHQTKLLASKSEELCTISERAHETMSSETLALQLEVNELESSKARLEEEINELHYRQQQLVLTNGKQSRQLESLKLEKEEREKEAVGYFNALERSREANLELQIQLDRALQKAQDPNSNGNSLFAEVEDRRAEMERKLIGMKVQYQSLQKQHAFSRQQMHRMKVQIATLLQLKGSHIDPEQLERLQSMVAQKNTEVEKLLVKVRQLEKCQTYENGQSKMDIDVLSQGDEVYYVDLLKMKLENSNKEMEKLKDELSLQRMKALAEGHRVLELERKLFNTDRHLKLSQSENMKLRISLDELRMKYEPDEIVRVQTQRRRREQLPLDCSAENAANSEALSVSGFNSVSDSSQNENRNIILSEGDTKTHGEESASCADPDVPRSQDITSNTQPMKESKRVRIAEDLNDPHSLSNKDITSTSPRSVSPPVLERSIQEGHRSFICRFVNYALQLILFFLNFAWCLFPIFWLPQLKIFSPFKKKLMGAFFLGKKNDGV
ncbi:protein Spindly isoform X2 [Dendrobates tinctorius]|uniref:protein Spindly isoform X2 n=1 Tax=Dendrobates tinctorius TaxID=92724 RepID=UPI003CC9E17A